MVVRSDGEPLYKVQGGLLSNTTEAMFRTWLAVLLVRGEEMTATQWWQEYDSQIRKVFHCVKNERKDEGYKTDLNAAVVALLDVYDHAPGTGANAAGAEAEEIASEDDMAD